MSPPAGRPLLLSWSGGKDSLMALRALRSSGARVAGLLTTITAGIDRVSMHGVRRSLLERQAASLGLPLWPVEIPEHGDNATYDAAMSAALAPARRQGIYEVAFGDLALADIRAYRQERLATEGMTAQFPLWGRDTAAFAADVLACGVQARLVCVDTEVLDADLVGRRYDEALLAALPTAVDPAGENGEFHTFVAAGPGLRGRIEHRVGDRVVRGRFAFVDLHGA